MLLIQKYLNLFCFVLFSFRENLIRHRKRHRACFQNCINCHREFVNNFELEHHMMQHHEKSYPCTNCPMSFLKTRELDVHLATYHQNETTKKQGIISRQGKTPEKSPQQQQQQFTGYKSKELIQKSVNPTMRKRKRLTYEEYRKKIGDVGRLSDNDSPPNEYWMYGKELRILSGARRVSMMSSNDHLLEEENLNIQREECTVPPSSFTDYSGSPVMFYKEENENDDSEKSETIARRSPKNDSPEKFNLFSVDIIPENSTIQVENDWETETNWSYRSKKSIKRKRRESCLPIEIDARYIPPYNVLFQQDDRVGAKEVRTLKEPFRYSG